jgi:hypothetical protein
VIFAFVASVPITLKVYLPAVVAGVLGGRLAIIDPYGKTRPRKSA